MIRVILQGRTGNNLFQYAAGRALSQATGQELVLDGAWMDEWHASHFKHLTKLPLKARYERKYTLAKRLGRKLLGAGPSCWHREPLVDEEAGDRLPNLEPGDGGKVLNGYFQSASNVSSIEAELRNEIDLTTIEIPEDSRRFEDSLREEACISIHVRRGDYLAIPSTNCIGNHYHERAILWFKERREDPRFCLFSDDIAWCRHHFAGPEFLFCELPAGVTDPLHDLRLMSSCHDHVIVNSSYSWWGAWLNPDPGKIVLAPNQWMTSLSSNEVIPPEWVTLESIHC